MSSSAQSSAAERTDFADSWLSAGIDREFSLSQQEFDDIRALVKEFTGINLGESKRQLIYRRLSGRLRATNLPTFNAYMDLLRNNPKQELEVFANAITTHLTAFFRESHHFDYLASTILPELHAASSATRKRLRIWSAGCSTGEEPYTTAMILQESLPDLAKWDARILATDLDSDVLAVGKAGVYARQRVEDMAPQRLRQWFTPSGDDDAVEVKPALRKLIAFKQLNLMREWPMRGPFDVIFCRNVIIYFDKPTQRVLMDRYANFLKEGGYLILGHSETLFNVSDRFELLGKTIYRKIK